MVMTSGVHTNILMAAILRGAGLRTGRRMSRIFHTTVSQFDRPLSITNAALSVALDLETKKAIASNAIDLCCALGIAEPTFALSSAPEGPSERMPSSVDVKGKRLSGGGGVQGPGLRPRRLYQHSFTGGGASEGH